MAQKIEGKDERPLQSFTLKNFLGVNTTNARVAPPANESFYALENAQPIGFGNIHSVNDISSLLHTFTGQTVYAAFNVNISNTEYLLLATTGGQLWAWNVSAQTATNITGGAGLSGSAVRATQWSNSVALIIDSSGYYQWSGSGSIALITGSGAPTSGSAIAVYQNIVWIAQLRTIFFSAPGSYTDFTTADGAGSTTIVDPVLRSNIIAMLAANGYLYFWGTSSVNAISDVYVPSGASPPTPSFTNLNLSPIVGTDQPLSVCTYGRLVLFANRWGIWSVYGATVQALSSPDPNNQYQSAVDGTWQYVNFNQAISGGQVVSNGLLQACFLMQRNSDPIFGSNTIILMYQGDAVGGKWWNANYGSVNVIATAFVANTPCLFAIINGNQLYQLFANAGSSPAALIKTGLWDMGDPITQKEVLRGGLGISATGAASLTLNLDTPRSTYPFTISVVGQVQWVNSSNAIVTWQNNALQTVQWQPGQFQTYWAAAPRGFAKYVGFTLTTTEGTGFEINTFLMDYKMAARWVGN